MDTDAVVRETQRIAVLRRFAETLDADVAKAAEIDATERARRWVAQQHEGAPKGAQRVAKAQATVRTRVAALVEAIESEAAARREAAMLDFATDVLCARFEIPRVRSTSALPALEDWTAPVLKATEALRPGRLTARLMPSHPAALTPERKRELTLLDVAHAVSRRGASLPADVREILDAAPLPSAPAGPRTADRPAREAQEAAGMASLVASTQRLLNAIPGSIGVGGL
jgi:hypothetical protein